MEVRLRKLSCSSCGAPVPFKSDEVVLTCGYCGTTYLVPTVDTDRALPEDGEQDAAPKKVERVEGRFLLPIRVNAKDSVAKGRDWLSRYFLKPANLASQAGSISVKGYLVPLWGVKVVADSTVLGIEIQRKLKCHRDRLGRSRWGLDVRQESAESKNSTEMYWPVLAVDQKKDSLWGLDALEKGNWSVQVDWGRYFPSNRLGWKKSGGIDLIELVGSEGVKPYNPEQQSNKMKTLAGHVSRTQAELSAQMQIARRVRAKESKRFSQVTSVDTQFQFRGTDLLFLPVWQMRYRYGRSSYRLLISGVNGEVLAGQHPVGRLDRALVVLAISLVVAVLAFLGGEIFDASDSWVGFVVGLGIGMFHAMWLLLFGVPGRTENQKMI